jgi:hypothetical protein
MSLCIVNKLQKRIEELIDMSSVIVNDLQKRIEELIKERETYMYVNCWRELYKKYVGVYKDKTLIVNHSYNKSFYPYGCDNYINSCTEDLVFVKGTWDNWNLQYPIYKKCADEKNPYEGYVYYITLDKELQNGDEHQYKFYDVGNCVCEMGNWIEPIIDDEAMGQKMVKNSVGTWNASLIIKPVPVY